MASPDTLPAWESADVNAATRDFYRGTRATLEGAWLRPRHNGYMPFQEAASHIVNDAVTGAISVRTAIDRLNDGFRASFRD